MADWSWTAAAKSKQINYLSVKGQTCLPQTDDLTEMRKAQVQYICSSADEEIRKHHREKI